MTTEFFLKKKSCPGASDKASHNLNDAKDEKQDERAAPGSGENEEDPASETQLSLPAGGGWGEPHMSDLMFAARTTGVLWAAGLHGSELPATADRGSLDVRNRSEAGRNVLNRKSERLSGS